MNVSVFDLDGTLLTINSSFSYYFFLYRKKVFPLSSIFHAFFLWIGYRFFFLTPDHLHKKVFKRFLYGKNEEEIKRYSQTFFFDHLSQFFDPTMLRILQDAKKNHDYVLILSSSPQFLVDPLLQYLQVDEVVGTKYAIDKENRFLHIDVLMNGVNKALYLKSVLKRLGKMNDQIKAYSDSFWDLPLLEEVSVPQVVRPDRKLKNIAKKRRWPIIL